MTEIKQEYPPPSPPRHHRKSFDGIEPAVRRNVCLQSVVSVAEHEVLCKPIMRDAATQTPAAMLWSGIIPFPLPITVPIPVPYFNYYVPKLLPIPIPFPFPVICPVGPEKYKEYVETEKRDYSRRILNLDDSDSNRTIPMEIDDRSATIRLNHSLSALSSSGPAPNCDIPGFLHIPTDREHNVTLGAKLFRDYIFKLHTEDSEVPISFLDFNTSALSNYLLMFILQLKRQDGSPCSPELLYFISVGIQYFLMISGRPEDIFYDSEFKSFAQVLFDRIQHCTVHIDPRDNCVYSRITESLMWKANQLGAHSPQTLLNTIFYLNIKSFLIRNVNDHYNLTFSNVRRHTKRFVVGDSNQDDDCEDIEYTEVNRENYLRYYPSRDPDLIYEQVETRHPAVRCAILIHEFYVSKCPRELRLSNKCLYLEPDPSATPESELWFTSKTISRETMTRMVVQTRMIKEMSELEIAFATNTSADDPLAPAIIAAQNRR